MLGYVQSLTQTAPPWLQGFWGSRWWQTTAAPLDCAAAPSEVPSALRPLPRHAR